MSAPTWEQFIEPRWRLRSATGRVLGMVAQCEDGTYDVFVVPGGDVTGEYIGNYQVLEAAQRAVSKHFGGSGL